MATESKPSSKPSRVVAVAIDNSEYAEKAFDCEYSFIYSLSIFHWKTIQFFFHFDATNRRNYNAHNFNVITKWLEKQISRVETRHWKILETIFQFENETLKTVAVQYADSHVL